MLSIITLICLFCCVIPASIGNIIAYPVSKKISLRISKYITKVCAPRVFAILKTYRHFNFWGYKKSKEGLPQQFIAISNHQSLLDIPVFMNFFREKNLRFVAKDTLGRHIPLVSEMLRVEEHCLIPRKAKPMEAMEYVGKFGKRCVERNQIPVLFPEGSRTKNGKVGKFYSAGFRKLVESSLLPVVVFALDGGYQIRDLTKLTANLKRGCYRIKALKIYDNPKTKEECNIILDEAQNMIQMQIDEWRKMPSTEK